MDAHKIRDELFSDIHNTLLKPLGFKKKGHWSVKSSPPFHWALYLRSSRWSRKDNASFWIDLYVYHEQFDSLMFGPRVFNGPSEGTPGIVNIELSRITTSASSRTEINIKTDVPALREQLMKSISEVALPFLNDFDSLEKIAQYQLSRNIPAVAPTIAAIYLLLGRVDDAEAVVKEAGKTAPNDHVRDVIERSLDKMMAQGNK